MNRILLGVSIVALSLLFLFFISTNFGFADISSIREKLRELQLRLIKERVKVLRGEVEKVGSEKLRESQTLPPTEPPVAREELAKRLEDQIRILEGVVASLKPKAIEEETGRLDKKIAEIRSALDTAEGERLVELQRELETVLVDYAKIEVEVKRSVEESLKQKQAAVIKEQIKILQEKILLVPRPQPALPTKAEPQDQERVKALQEAIEKIRLKILQTQVKALQEKVGQVKSQ